MYYTYQEKKLQVIIYHSSYKFETFRLKVRGNFGYNQETTYLATTWSEIQN